PLHSADGVPLLPPTPTITPTSGAATPTQTPSPTLSPTPRPTPLVNQPGAEAAERTVAPPPSAGEAVYVVQGERIPANPLRPIPIRSNDGRAVELDVGQATIEIWSGIFSAESSQWTPATAELLWPDAELYVVGSPAADNPDLLVAERVRIARAPRRERVEAVDNDDLADAIDQGIAISLIGSREEVGVYLLENTATVRQLWLDEQSAQWLNGREEGGIVVNSPTAPMGANTFTWVRPDGMGLKIAAQPYFTFSGVTGDVYGGLWWIETPEVNLDQWQLWHYDPLSERIVLALQSTGELFSASSRVVNNSLRPFLLAAAPQFDAESGRVTQVELLLDTLDAAKQSLYMGVFKLAIELTDDGRGTVVGLPQLLLTPENYRGPLQLSPDHSKLAFFAYDASIRA
ncbi:MAG: hypothetical protein HC802_17355, partial [Caldilineaceae bacterium]|nr:hypothetical protein [Caldilineaceae bacterium]